MTEIKNKPRIYVAGASLEAEQRAGAWIKQLEEVGFEITYDWTKPVLEYGAAGEKKPLTDDELTDFAREDFEGLASAEILWVLAPPGRSTGVWWELGAAWALSSFQYLVRATSVAHGEEDLQGALVDASYKPPEFDKRLSELVPEKIIVVSGEHWRRCIFCRLPGVRRFETDLPAFEWLCRQAGLAKAKAKP